jgi:DNA replication protein DnaC
MSPTNIKAEINDIAERVMRLQVEEPVKTELSPKEKYYLDKYPTPEALLRGIGVGKRHEACSFETYQGKEKTVTACKEFIDNPADIVLTGVPGTGKTHLAVAILRELAVGKKIKSETDACFIPVPELLAEIRASYRDGDPDERDIIDRYSRLPFLVLDDLGAEKTTEWSITTLYLIIDRRYRNMRPTIITTNLSLEQIAVALSERISSRLASGKVLLLTGQDYRMKRGGT